MKRLLTISAICISLFAYAQKPQFTPKPHPRIGVKNDIPAGPFAIIDLDQDGDKDLIVDTQYDNLKLYLNQGNGDFKEIPTPCAFQVAIIQMAVVDLQNDGDDDLLLSRHDKAFMVLENKGNFNFELRADTSVAPQKSYVFHAGDLNGDQYPDGLEERVQSIHRRLSFCDGVMQRCTRHQAHHENTHSQHGTHSSSNGHASITEHRHIAEMTPLPPLHAEDSPLGSPASGSTSAPRSGDLTLIRSEDLPSIPAPRPSMGLTPLMHNDAGLTLSLSRSPPRRAPPPSMRQVRVRVWG